MLTTLNQLFIPIKSVIVSMINEEQNNRDIFNMAAKVTILVFSVVLLYLWIGEPIIMFLLQQVGQGISGISDKIGDITQGIELSGLITIGMPFYIVVHLIFMSLLLVKNQKRFAGYGIINAIVTFLIYYVCVNNINASPLVAVCIATAINYLVTYLFNGVLVIGIKEGIKLILLSLGLVLTCLILMKLDNMFIYPIILIPLIVYLILHKLKKNKEK